MRIKSLLFALVTWVICNQSSFGQGGPTLVDYLNPRAWWNPVYDFQPNWLDPHFPTTVLAGQTVWVATRQQLAQKHKDYYVFFDHHKQNGAAKSFWVSSNEHMAYLAWNDPSDSSDTVYYYPSEGGFDTIYTAIPFSEYDPRCFQEFNGPYCQVAENVSFVGQSGGYWVAISGFSRVMGGAFTATQIDKIKAANKNRNAQTMKSDLRAQLVNEFLALHPEVNPTEIPVDTSGNTLNNNSNSDSCASVSHILPAIAPAGNGCGRNTYRNALLVSKKMKKKLDQAGFPSDSFILYCEFLAEKYNKSLPSPTPPKAITIRRYKTQSELARLDAEYPNEEEFRAMLDYAENPKRN